MSEISLTRIANLVSELKHRVEKYRDKLMKNEMLVRYMLIDPLLRALGWDLENPEQVEPEYVVESGRADYAVKQDGRVIAFIEAKPLGGISEEAIKEKLKYAFDSGVEYTVITDGDTWLVYETFKKAEWRDRKIAEWSITKEDPFTVAFKSIILANIPLVGRRPEKPMLERIAEKSTQAIEQRSVTKIKGPLSSRLAEYLVLKVLASSTKPMKRKEIVERARELIELTDEDFERTKSGGIRWITRIDWSISTLSMTGMINRLDRNQYIISDKGKSRMKTLEEEIARSA